MYKHCLIYIITIAIFASCKSKQHVIVLPKGIQNHSLDLHVNDSVNKFNKLENMIISKAEAETTFNNPITFYFKKHISQKLLDEIEFNAWRKNIHLEFTVDHNNNLLSLTTNSASKKLDIQIKKSFKRFNLRSVNNQEFNPIYKYTIVVIQNINNKAIIKCNSKAISYIPPIFNNCKNVKSYQALNRCNYIYITEHLYNNVDLSLVNDIDIENNHQIYPKLIIDKDGKVIAAKVESENKQFLESYYKAIINLPQAIQPAKFNNLNEYYGYNFPTSITNIINNNNSFKAYYNNKPVDFVNAKKMMKNYVHQLQYNKLVSNQKSY